MLDAGVPASFEDVEKADDVAVDIDVRVAERRRVDAGAPVIFLSR